MNRHFIVLDGLRGIASLVVFFVHAPEVFSIFPAIPRGHLAVDFFFMLSGFVVAYAYEGKLLSGMSFGRFTAIRLVRLYPMVFFGVVLGAVSRLADGAAGYSAIAVFGASAVALLMLPLPRNSATPVSAFPLNGPLWSLTFELISNLLYAIAMPRLSTKTIVGLSATLIPALALASYTQNGINFGMDWAPVSLFAIIRVMCPFTIGLLIFRLASHSERPSGQFGLAAPILLLAVLLAPVENGALFDFLAVCVAFPAVMLIGIRAPDNGSLRRIWIWLGALSYPVYAINQPLIRIAGIMVGDLQGMSTGQQWLLIFTVFLACLLFSAAALMLYDQPVRKWLSRNLLHRAVVEPTRR